MICANKIDRPCDLRTSGVLQTCSFVERFKRLKEIPLCLTVLFILFIILIFTGTTRYGQLPTTEINSPCARHNVQELTDNENNDETSCSGPDCVRKRMLCSKCTILASELTNLRQKVAMYERLNKLLEFNSWMSQHGSKMRQNILILSGEHCGSSLLGELFNQNPQVFYLYEPLRSLNYYRDNRPPDVYDAMVTHLLDGIFHCKFDELTYFTNYMSFQYSSLKSRLASRALSAPPLCPEHHEHTWYNIRMCTPLKPKTTSAICKLHQHTVSKIIQFSEVHKLSYLMDKESEEYSFKVVHLVRDPRAIVYTYLQHTDNSTRNHTTGIIKDISRKFCSQILRNIKYAITAPSWLQGKYTLLRYEDLGINPHQIAELVYKFVGIPIAPQVRVWLDKLTNGITTKVPQTSSSTSGSIEEFDAKNLTGSVHNWRIQMHYSIVRVIETECYEVMNLLGYKIVEDEEELTTLSLSLVD